MTSNNHFKGHLTNASVNVYLYIFNHPGNYPHFCILPSACKNILFSSKHSAFTI